MDIGNPYLTARYDGRIVDSLPWGRGWLVDGSMVGAKPYWMIGLCDLHILLLQM
jgi:hypothetical protein